MARIFAASIIFFCLLFLAAGCATRQAVTGTQPGGSVASEAPAEKEEVSRVARPVFRPQPAPLPPSPPERPPPVAPERAPIPGPVEAEKPVAAAVEDYVLAVESLPAGAIILVNNVPVGKAPLKVMVKGTPQGFTREYTTVKARFLARDPTEVSSTIEVEITTLEKVPTLISFTPEGYQRQVR